MNESISQPFRIIVRPSPETNDHEVRFVVDGEDIIARFWGDMLGLDPDDILIPRCPLIAPAEPRQAIVARCSCGEIGCGSVEVEIGRSEKEVTWKWKDTDSTQTLQFPADCYDAELQRALTDTSWETPDRTAVRLLANQVDRKALATHGLTFTWASGRLRKGKFSVSLRLAPDLYQFLVHLPWDTESPEEIAQKFVELLREYPSKWPGVEWFPQQANLGPPPWVGTDWRRGS